jgi:hypothetical protein
MSSWAEIAHGLPGAGAISAFLSFESPSLDRLPRQIRVHLKEIGHPLAVNPLHGRRASFSLSALEHLIKALRKYDS